MENKRARMQALKNFKASLVNETDDGLRQLCTIERRNKELGEQNCDIKILYIQDELERRLPAEEKERLANEKKRKEKLQASITRRKYNAVRKEKELG
jgi:hypothetical protein